MAVNSTASDGEIMRLRSSSAMVKFNSSGLLQSLNGSSFNRVNPFLGIIKLTFNSENKYDSEWRFWWGSGNAPKVTNTKTATGTITLKHNANLSAYLIWNMLIISGSKKYGRTVSCINNTSVESTVYIMNGNALADLQNVGDVVFLMFMNNSSV